MRYKQNLHIHSTYCDGKNTPQEIAEEAILQGFDSIGFSGHSCVPFLSSFSMTLESEEAYFACIKELKKEYEGRLKIYLGLEFDSYSHSDTTNCDYLIGSVHHLFRDGDCFCFDSSAARVQHYIDRYFDGDGMAYAKSYYEALAKLPDCGKFDILGHADIICKHEESRTFFCQDSPDYRRWVCNALDALEGQIPLFEVNSGAIARGFRTTPYPAPFLLDELKKRGFGAVITSDCHDRRLLSLHFPEAEKLLWEHGFREVFVLTDDGFIPTPL